MTTDEYKKQAPTVPFEPGIYKFLMKNDKVLYVGKAKNLRKRIASYFGSKKQMSYKTKIMVKMADRFEYIVVNSEQDALILENNFIKKYKPRFNVAWKDDKSYTYIVVKNERFPRVFFTRKLIDDGSKYYGPYTSKKNMSYILDTIKSLFPLRTCSLNLTEKNINDNKFNVCLEYHINNCLGPCVAKETEEEYYERIVQVKNILNGNLKPVRDYLKNKMNSEADQLNFENAQNLKFKIDLLDHFQSNSTVINHKFGSIDVFSIIEEEDFAYINYLKIVNGLLMQSDTIKVEKNLNQDRESVLRFAIPLFRNRFNSTAQEIILPFEIDYLEDVKQVIPKRGTKLDLLKLSNKNASYFRLKKKKEDLLKLKKVSSSERILKTVQTDLRMKEVPMHIECFDNSNIQGSHPVASCVVFKNAKPSKSDYRKFNIKTVEGPNDFASMEEVIYRRYKRLLDEKKDLPQLIVIDGGKGQLNAALKSIEKLDLIDQITVIGIAKRLEEIFMAYDPIPIYIDKRSESLKLIQHLRNEAHRFALGFHRDQRSKSLKSKTLTQIQGIGKNTEVALLKKFGSVKRVKIATLEQLAAVIGISRAKKVYNYFQD